MQNKRFRTKLLVGIRQLFGAVTQSPSHPVTALLLVLLMVFVPVVSSSACPTCKEALFEPDQLAQKLSAAKGYGLSIALLLGMPVALLGGVAALIVRAQRQKRAAN